MSFNKYSWGLYKRTEGGIRAIQLFNEGDSCELINKFAKRFAHRISVDSFEGICDNISILNACCIEPKLPDTLTIEGTQLLFESIIKDGVTLRYEDGVIETAHFDDIPDAIYCVSTWLYLRYPDWFKPYFFTNQFYLLTRIADTFGIELLPVPLKKDKEQRHLYYFDLCLSFSNFQIENE